MNKQRKQEILNVVNQINSLNDDLEGLKDEEDESRENFPENLQSSERYTFSEEISDVLSESVDDIKSATQNIIDML